MSSNASKNLGVKFVASFEDGALALNAPACMDRSGKPSRSANEGGRLLADHEDDVLSLNGSLNVLFAQHEQKVQRLVNKLQGVIEELKKQNADLQGVLLFKDQVINRYHLDGPNEDEI